MLTSASSRFCLLAGVHPTIPVYGFGRILWVVKVAHENITAPKTEPSISGDGLELTPREGSEDLCLYTAIS
jgi:hypothetical protein